MSTLAPSYVVELIVIGLAWGCLYALVALGYSIIYGIVRVINFSHGEIYTFGAYIGYLVLTITDAPLFLAIIASGTSCVVLIVIFERTVFRPVGYDQKLTLLMAHIGLSLLIRSILSAIFGEQFRSLPGDRPVIFEFGQAQISSAQLTIIIATLVLGLVLWAVMSRSTFGRMLRAVAQDRDAAIAKGIPVSTVIMGAYALGAFYGGAAGVLCGSITELTPQMGGLVGIKAFTACVLGGIGRVPGAIVGGLVLGLFEAFAVGYFGTQYQEIFAFALLAACLLIVPRGFLRGHLGAEQKYP